VDDAVVLRDFDAGDQGRVRHLILDGLAEHWGSIDESLNRDLDDIAVSYAEGTTLVACVGDEVVGTGTVVRRDESAAEIVRMSVAPMYRRRGLGRRLVAELVEAARNLGATRVILETSSRWTEVIAFYSACGFDVIGEQDGAFGTDTWFEMQL
jgi:ribosomal protein S18 acetylase RimI-like enzyme